MKISTQKQKTDKNAVFGGIGIFSVSLLAAVSAVYIFNPTVGTHAAESQEAEINLTVGSAISITTDKEQLNLDATVGSFVQGSVNVGVVTNSQYGYTLTLEDSDNDASMHHEDASVTNKVTSFYSGAKTGSTMADNTWGFSLDETNFYMIPTLGNPVRLKNTNSPVASSYDTTKVDFGVKVGMDLTAGTYEDVVKFTAYVNGDDGRIYDNDNDSNDDHVNDNILNPGTPPETRTIADISNMQEINSKICANTAVGATASLTDVRNGNVYSIKKGKDNNCWMTKNLALVDYTLTSVDSDVPDDFSFHVPASMDNIASTYDSSTSAYFKFPAAHLDATHGGYYNYHTAAGGWDGAEIETNVNTPQSICPKGWRLPTGTYGGEFDYLYSTAYRYDAIDLMNDLQLDLNGQYSNATLEREGEVGSWWSASGYSGYSFAQYLWLNPSQTYGKINSAGYASPTYGFGVRCIAR